MHPDGFPADTPATRRAALRRAVERAVLAPSIHNTQPWRFLIDGDQIELRADPGRRLHVLDPRGRQLTISCGCALFNLRVSLAASRVRAAVHRLPDPGRPALLARVDAEWSSQPDWTEADLARLDEEIPRRRTNRRAFAQEAVAEDLVDRLVAHAAYEGARLVPITDPDDRRVVARLARIADQAELDDPDYRAELEAWTTDDLRRPDGVQAFSVPHGANGRHDELPLRNFDTRGTGWLPSRTESTAEQCLLLLCSPDDCPLGWLRAGEALQRIWLDATAEAYAMSVLTQLTEVARTHAELRARLELSAHPMALLRLGRAPLTPASRRRELRDVLIEGHQD